jgi:fucose 4-O-acetylase-like acetyltransferase
LNVFEAIAAYFVVFIHCAFPNQFGSVVTGLARFAVPLFFIVSGYFYYNKNNNYEIAKIGRKIKNLLLILFFSELFYFLFYSFLSVRKYGLSLFSIIKLIEAQLKGYNIESLYAIFPLFNGVGWFVIELILVYLVYYFISKYQLYILSYTLSVFFLVAGIGCVYVLNLSLFLQLSFLLMGFPFFTIGHYLHSNKERILKLSNNLIFLLLGFSLFVFAIEYFTLGYKMNYYSTSLLAIILFTLSLKFEKFLPKNICTKLLDKIGNNYTTFIYIMHPFVNSVVGTLAEYIIRSSKIMNVFLWLYPILMCFIVTCLAYIFTKVKNYIFHKS